MKSLVMICTSHLLGLVVMLFCVFRLTENIAGLPDYRLAVGLTAITVLFISHVRLWHLGRTVDSRSVLDKVSLFIVSGYLATLLILTLLDFGR